MILMAVFAVMFVWTLQRKKPSSSDLGLDVGLNKFSIALIVVVFIATHLIFYILGKVTGMSSDPVALFKDFGFDKGFTIALITVVSAAILAPVCEEILYRGVMLRAFHDGLRRWFRSKAKAWVPVVFSVLTVALIFTLPHVSTLQINAVMLSYLISSAGFSMVYILTGSLTAAMVSHSLQSCYAISSILIFGRQGTCSFTAHLRHCLGVSAHRLRSRSSYWQNLLSTLAF